MDGRLDLRCRDRGSYRGESWMAHHSPYAKAIDYAAARLREKEASDGQ